MQLSFRYPRIYSLSTVGIIYHGDCDYVLHPHCTSFAGDSGVGKSIVADLLQLLFTGPGVYESATHSQQPRKLPGLVANGLAYAYANIEVAHKQYVGLGCYLEAAGTAYPFLVYRGYHDELLTAFEQPLGFRDFIFDGQIKPYKIWAERLRQHPSSVRAQAFSASYRRYHEILHKNHILPLDVGNSDGLLKNYAKIIRSFARSGELEKGSINYLEFLFGKETEVAIWEDYQALLKEFEQDGREQHGQNTLIEEIKDKIANFRSLLTLQSQAQQAQLAFAAGLVRYRRYQTAAIERELSELRYTSQQHTLSYFCLHAELLRRKAEVASREQKEYSQSAKQKPELEKKQFQLAEAVELAKVAEKTTYTQVDYLNTQQLDAVQIEQWLAGQFGPSAVELLQAQRQQEQHRVEGRQLEAFLAHLEANNLVELFTVSAWANGSPDTDHFVRLHNLQERLTSAEQLQKFNDLHDEDSLARWALTQGILLSREQESILAHFSSLSKLRTRTATAGMRYLADPATLLAPPLPLLPGDSESGFWLDLRGIGKWIPRLEPNHCVFFDTDTVRIERLLSQRAAAAGQTVEELRQLVESEQRIEKVLETYSEDWRTALRLYARREELATTAETEANALPDERKLQEMLQRYVNLEQIRRDLTEAQRKHREAVTHRSAQETAIIKISKDLEACDKVLLATNQDKLAERLKLAESEQHQMQHELAQWLRKHQISSETYQQHIVPTVADALTEAEDEMLRDERATHKAGRENADKEVEATELSLSKSQTQVVAAEQAFQKVTGHAFEGADDDTDPAEPDEAEAEDAKFEYEKLFSILAAPLGTDGTRLSYQESAKLIQQAVPAAFKTYLDQPEQALDELLAYLEEISAKSNQLAEHKLTRLGDLLNRVRTTAKAYMSEIQELESYFRRREAGIAGGFNAKLRVSMAPEYPLEWLHHFQDALNAKTRGETEAFDALRQHENLQKLMRATYLEKGGKNTQATVQELLNPKSYLRLTYHMEVEGQVNHGSTGQTFMAAALLNVARLSLIGREGQQKRRPGVRFMPVDEAAGLGSNYTNLLKLAAQQGYQVISLAIEPVLDADPETVADHRIYVLGAGQPKAKLNLLPMLIRGTQAEPLNENDFYAPTPNLFSSFNDAN